MKKNDALQAVKFALFSASAGIIQVVSFTILNEFVLPNINIQNEKLMALLSAEYGVCYLIALILSVLWNFTFNRRFTFKSAANIPIAMAKVFGFYLVFTPVSTWLGNAATRKGINEYIVLGVTMLSNMVRLLTLVWLSVWTESFPCLPNSTAYATALPSPRTMPAVMS